MSETNERTIAAYNAHVEDYIANTPPKVSRTAQEWLDASLDGLSSDARIIEIGSGFGHDAYYIESKGYRVERTDVTPGFVELLRSQGYTVRELDILTEEIEGSYNLVVANAVYHHFTKAEAITASKNILGALSIGGRFAVSSRLGHPEGWSDEKLGAPRYFTNWGRTGFEELIRNVGFSNIHATDSHKQDFTWLHIIATK